MKLKPFFRMLTVEQLQRVADATAWHSWVPFDYDGGDAVCLLCHASGNEYSELKGTLFPCALNAENRYIGYADRHGQEKAGWLMAYIARAELARRTLSALKPEQLVVSPESSVTKP